MEKELKQQLKIQKEGKDELKQKYKSKEIAFINNINYNLLYLTDKKLNIQVS
jgi:hypothetical protein